MKDLCYAERMRRLNAERMERERIAYEASLPWIFRISARIEVWALIFTAGALASAFAGGMFK